MIYKRILIMVAAMLLPVMAYSQGDQSWRKLESVFQIGGGLFLETGEDHRIEAEAQNPGAVLRVSYGLDMRFNEKWSVMPGGGFRIQAGGLRRWQQYGGDRDGMLLADVFVAARYHLDSGRSRVVFGLGPAFSYIVSPVYYDYPSYDIEKFRRFDIGIQPSVEFLLGNHFQWGMEANIGLSDIRLRHMELNTPFESTYQHYLALTCGWHF